MRQASTPPTDGEPVIPDGTARQGVMAYAAGMVSAHGDYFTARDAERFHPQTGDARLRWWKTYRDDLTDPTRRAARAAARAREEQRIAAEHTAAIPVDQTPSADLVRDAATIIIDLRMADDLLDGVPGSVITEAEQTLTDALAAHRKTGPGREASSLPHPADRRPGPQRSPPVGPATILVTREPGVLPDRLSWLSGRDAPVARIRRALAAGPAY
jgi:hypothetical protein